VDAQNPTILIIVKAPTGKVHQVYVKTGADYSAALPDIIAKPEVDHETRRNIDALSPTPPRYAPLERPVAPPPSPAVAVQPAPVLPEVPEVLDAPSELDKFIDESNSDGVDLKVGMSVVWKDTPADTVSLSGKVEQIWEEAGQILVNSSDGKKKVISPSQILEIATS